MQRSQIPEARGILKQEKGNQRFQLFRFGAAPDLEPWIENYWTVRWDLRDVPPYTQEILPHPSVNITIEHQKSRIVGVVSKKFKYQLLDQGVVFGAKFWPGTFYPLWQSSVSELTDVELPLSQKFGGLAQELEEAMLSCAKDVEMVDLMESFLRQQLPATDEHAADARQLVRLLSENAALLKVEDLADHTGRSVRSLQRLFRQYVGVSPKWVIKRFRLLEAAERMAAEPSLDLLQLALELQYFDQAHFIKDFKSIVGVSPAHYIRQL